MMRLGMSGHPRKHTFTAFPVLSSDTLFLRRVVPSDAPDIRDISVYDGVAATTDQDVLGIMARIEQDYERGDSLHWGICQRGSDEVVGTCGFYRGYPDNVGEVGYVLREAYRSKGIMSAALQIVCAFGVQEMKLAGIVAYTTPTNAASIGVLKRVSFRLVSSKPDRLKFAL